MQLRCKACNAKLSAFDFGSKKSQELPEEEDLCSVCVEVVYSIEDTYIHEYQHEHLTENWQNFCKYSENT